MVEIIGGWRRRKKAESTADSILTALQVAGRSRVFGGIEAVKMLNNFGMDNDTIVRMKRRYQKDPVGVRISLEKNLLDN